MKYTSRKRKIEKGVKKCLGVLGGIVNHLVKRQNLSNSVLPMSLLPLSR